MGTRGKMAATTSNPMDKTMTSSDSCTTTALVISLCTASVAQTTIHLCFLPKSIDLVTTWVYTDSQGKGGKLKTQIHLHQPGEQRERESHSSVMLWQLILGKDAYLQLLED